MSLSAALARGLTGLAVAAYLNGRYHISRDLDIIRQLKGLEAAHNQAIKDDRLSPWYLFENVCKKYPDIEAVWTRGSTWTFAEIYDEVSRYAQWLFEQGIQPGEMVAFYLKNSAEFLIMWFACHAIGAAPAFLNYHLEGKALVHCLSVCETNLMIVDDDEGCQKRIEGSRDTIEGRGIKTVVLNEELKRQLHQTPAIVPDERLRKGVKGDFPFALLYTSGTTGLPKGCAFTVSRIHLFAQHLEPPFGTRAGVDRWYNSMPLYHGTGAILAARALFGGVSIAIAPQFSVSGFWPDICDSGSTCFVYVGETARYLLNAPPHPLERKHKLRVAYGNGLRPDVWEKLQERFNIPEVAEFFSSSEGMFSLLAYDKGPYLRGVVGHHGLVMRLLFNKVYIPVKVDHDTGEIWRDPETGFAKRMPYDEGGEILVAIPDRSAFQGYWRSEEATDKKFMTDVFKNGDLYYRSGDALRRDSDGRWFFMDRLGDTFRWKSENVSTAEVAQTLGIFPGITEANVYGVTVPHHEGRAGCAAIHLDGNTARTIRYSDLLSFVRKQLPRYAVPVFLRLVKDSTHLHNHKQNKVSLRKEGVDPGLIGSEDAAGKEDVILWLRPGSDDYVPFGAEDWIALQKGQTRL